MRTKAILVLACALGLTTAAAAGEWQKSADLSLNLTQSGYSNAWAGGENGTLGWTWNGNLVLENQFNPSLHLRNDLKMQFGQTHQQYTDAEGDRKWARPVKSNDRIFDEALLQFTLGGPIDPYAAVTLETQFYDGKVPSRKFMFDPLQVTESIGGSRTLAKDELTELITRIGFGLRETRDKEVDPADPAGTVTSSETDGGLEWVTDLTRTFSGGDLKVSSKLRLFKALFNSNKDELAGTPQADYWKTIDVAWEATLSASVSKYVQTTMFFELLYDKQISTDTRWRETLGLGVAYKLF